ncbi:MAG TPA: recombinase zinc beta ribbon domain-containing protein, partial [Planctomycetota bacterium]|nr:recombinase zinc beta ribbon domain-containing protein [Planctomycetota bacterium]
KEKSKPRLRKHRHQYNLLIKCNECGRSYTGYTTTKKSGLEFTYYVCSEKHGECKNLQISEKEVEEQIAKYVGEVKLDEEKWAKLKALVLQKLEKEFNFESTVRKGVDIQIDQVNEKLDSLFDMKINKEIEIDDYQIKYKKIKDELNTLKSKRTDVEVTKDELKDEVDKFFDDIQTFKEVFLNGDYHEKRNLLFEITSHLGIVNKIVDLNLKEPYKSVAFVKNSNDSNKWGHVVDLFRTRIIETELCCLTDSIQLIFDKFNIVLNPL